MDAFLVASGPRCSVPLRIIAGTVTYCRSRPREFTPLDWRPATHPPCADPVHDADTHDGDISGERGRARVERRTAAFLPIPSRGGNLRPCYRDWCPRHLGSPNVRCRDHTERPTPPAAPPATASAPTPSRRTMERDADREEVRAPVARRIGRDLHVPTPSASCPRRLGRGRPRCRAPGGRRPAHAHGRARARRRARRGGGGRRAASSSARVTRRSGPPAAAATAGS